ncbi:eukaryotic translation initiation factor 5A-1-like isoform X2 [Haliotis rubra]|uniref:eukaryotic translation initiation factor 5A-1-like isoform X2 n=1 Tax=Haliotis rubra TaxID=36100 RepID=UPI001EE583FB|nr:eukaryotic translation initiation factor 5A-1-like isoform X2 [Haliotis rubra]
MKILRGPYARYVHTWCEPLLALTTPDHNLVTKMNDAADEIFEQACSGASKTYPKQCSALKKGGHVLLKQRPCKIVEMSTSKTGKHGHAKVHLVGLDIFTGKKYEDVCPSTHNMIVPTISRLDYQCIGVDEGYLSLLDDKGLTRNDLRLPDNDMGQDIQRKAECGDDFVVTVQTAMDDEIVVAMKSMKAID